MPSQLQDAASSVVAPASSNRVPQRPDLSNRALVGSFFAAVALVSIYFVLLPSLPDALQVPGSPVVYLIGVAGTLLLSVAAVFVLVKRTGRGGSPVAWFIAHVGCGTLGFVLIAVHSTGRLDGAPALLMLNLLALMVLGIWARLRVSGKMADTFGTKLRGFAVPNEDARATLAEIISKKSCLLAELDPMAQEATFSVTLAHLTRRPISSLSYLRLVRAEERLMGTRRSVNPAQAWWRPLHMVLAVTFVIGLLIHIVMVTFFAGYVADGGPVNWWHISAWNL